MTIQEKLSELREEYKIASEGRRRGILFQVAILKNALGKPFPKIERNELYEEALKIFKAEVKPGKPSELQTPVQRLQVIPGLD